MVRWKRWRDEKEEYMVRDTGAVEMERIVGARKW